MPDGKKKKKMNYKDLPEGWAKAVAEATMRNGGFYEMMAEEERKRLENLKVGDKDEDGSVFAGMTEDGKQRIYAMSEDLNITMTFNEAAKKVEDLNAQNALGHDDWHIPTREDLRTLYRHRNEGALKGTFKTVAGSGSDYPQWYFSCSGTPSIVWGSDFSDGNEYWHHKDNNRLSCRPVRLVPCKAP